MFLSPLSLKSSSSFFFLKNLLDFCICLFCLNFASFNCFFLYFPQLEERERLPAVIRLTGVKLSPILYISSNEGTRSEGSSSNVPQFASSILVRLLTFLISCFSSSIYLTLAATRILSRQLGVVPKLEVSQLIHKLSFYNKSLVLGVVKVCMPVPHISFYVFTGIICQHLDFYWNKMSN
ncbi:hypothetical protein CXB51_025688 [Gossypium anomalum]|uniref:Uncharacterized protein n=1 Tax=Gossypium anomalum TaxID=47600 RepID=A0A8J6CN12_9ROSI|nr:hypothetical protein CXB51_025688 [Gossypium anomalum]